MASITAEELSAQMWPNVAAVSVSSGKKNVTVMFSILRCFHERPVLLCS